MLRWSHTGFILASLLLPSTSAAQVDRDAEARSQFEEGRAAFEGQRYGEAALAFERSFELSGRPVLLLNAGNAWDRAGHPDRALGALRQYLVLVSDGPLRPEIEERVALLEAQTQLQEAPTPAPAESPEPAMEVDDAPGPFDGRLWTWVALGSAVALGAAAGWLYHDASQDYAALAETCGVDGSCSETQVGRVESDLVAVWTTLGLGTAALGVAVALYFFEAPTGDEDVGLALLPTGASVSGTF